jgi:hypothetical protein
MSVRDMAFLIDRLNADCSQLQFLRELTQNGLEAIQQLDNPVGEIRWEIDRGRLALTEGDEIPQSKLCVIDTGIGMSGPDMVKYINHLSSSIHTQSKTGNFGVGAKISAAPLNSEGLVYLSWVDGKGAMIHLYRDSKNRQYGLKRFDNNEYWQQITNDVRPAPIKDHGTMVVLLGTTEFEDTMIAPPGAATPKKWVLRYLNSRYFRFPEGVKISAQEGHALPSNSKHNFLRTVDGQGAWLNRYSTDRGVVRLDDTCAKVHWWIIDENADTDSGHFIPRGHVSMLHKDELYNTVLSTAGYARLQSFGVVFGPGQVVLYIEPDNGENQAVIANTARTHLTINGEPVDWSLYAAEFRGKMPDELIEYQDRIGQKTDHKDYRKAIHERLKAVSDLFRFNRYRPNPSGKYRSGFISANTGGSTSEQTERTASAKSSSPGTTGGKRGDIYSQFTEATGEPADLISGNTEPEIIWVSAEAGTREPTDMEDRAARYLSEQHSIVVNADFRAFADMIDRWELQYAHAPSARVAITAVVQEWFSQQLIETIMSALALRQAGKWSTEEVQELWSESALTAAVLARYHIDLSIKRVLGQKLGSLSAVEQKAS